MHVFILVVRDFIINLFDFHIIEILKNKLLIQGVNLPSSLVGKPLVFWGKSKKEVNIFTLCRF